MVIKNKVPRITASKDWPKRKSENALLVRVSIYIILSDTDNGKTAYINSFSPTIIWSFCSKKYMEKTNPRENETILPNIDEAMENVEPSQLKRPPFIKSVTPSFILFTSIFCIQSL